MPRIFDRNIFIMMLSVMAGFIIITYFVADIVHNSQIQQLNTEHTSEIETIEKNNIHFTSSFLESSVLLDSAREDRAFGNYHFDLAQLFYTSALSEFNETKMDAYKENCISNCTNALPKYFNANQNFLLAATFFDNTKQYTNFSSYVTLLTMYVNLSNSGARLVLLRYNATMYLSLIAEKIIYENNGVILDNATDLLDLFNETMTAYSNELSTYEDFQDEIDEYDIEGFSTIREIS
jgi:hypothetical protein